MSEPLLASGFLLGPYRVYAALGAGGMGEVYRAVDTRLGRAVAVKVLSAHRANDPDRLKRFEQEARVVASLSHANVLALHDVGSQDGVDYAVFELLEGQTLRQRMESGALPVSKAVEYGVQICQGLDAIHARGIVHRDLKPDNVFLTRSGQIKILDFGLAKLGPRGMGILEGGCEARTATEPGLLVGTCGYMAPEQARGRPADPRSDIFSVGAVLYEMLSGRRAFAGQTPADTLAACVGPGSAWIPPCHGPSRARWARGAAVPGAEPGGAVPVRAGRRVRAQAVSTDDAAPRRLAGRQRDVAARPPGPGGRGLFRASAWPRGQRQRSRTRSVISSVLGGLSPRPGV